MDAGESKEVESAEDSVGCRNCQQPEIEPGYNFSLCRSCREQMAQRPLPQWIRGTAALVGVVLLLAFIRFPASLSAGIAFDRGHRAETSQHYTEAVTQYQKVVTRFPDSTPVLVRLCVVSFHAGQLDVTAHTLNKLQGRELSKEQADEVYTVSDKLEALVKQIEKLDKIGQAYNRSMLRSPQGAPTP
ncbi:MAG: hypothetical protein JO316_00200 [Abitibacteriaceae bacterium]|nr:hypothetical protein [Abditibacteriaceae bacterium]MBV9863747.1 hypothetical protein [Abditibacteriaceae bacterium]